MVTEESVCHQKRGGSCSWRKILSAAGENNHKGVPISCLRQSKLWSPKCIDGLLPHFFWKQPFARISSFQRAVDLHRDSSQTTPLTVNRAWHLFLCYGRSAEPNNALEPPTPSKFRFLGTHPNSTYQQLHVQSFWRGLGG